MSEETTIFRLKAGFMIIESWYGTDNCSICAEHDQIYYGPDDFEAKSKRPLPEFFIQRLADLGWMDEDYGWSIFV